MILLRAGDLNTSLVLLYAQTNASDTETEETNIIQQSVRTIQDKKQGGGTNLREKSVLEENCIKILARHRSRIISIR